jgi:hypothetical protein
VHGFIRGLVVVATAALTCAVVLAVWAVFTSNVHPGRAAFRESATGAGLSRR